MKVICLSHAFDGYYFTADIQSGSFVDTFVCTRGGMHEYMVLLGLQKKKTLHCIFYNMRFGYFCKLV